MLRTVASFSVVFCLVLRELKAFPGVNAQGSESRQYNTQAYMPSQLQQPPSAAPYGQQEQHPNMIPAASSYDSYSKSGSNYDSYGGGDYYNFDCYGKKPAFYGDSNYDCKVYHVCQADGRSDTFRCPKWTRFNNYLGICDWHFKVDSYCNPLYKEEPYGGQNYQSGY